ncbi:MAG: hypothetical protein U0441_09855 [Polyangiaceae bacterium]
MACEWIAPIPETSGGGGGGAGSLKCPSSTVAPAPDCTDALPNGTLSFGGGLTMQDCVQLGDFGSAQVPTWVGGMVFSPEDPDRLLVVGGSASESAALYSIPVQRDPDCHVAALGIAEKIADLPNADPIAVGPDKSLLIGIVSYSDPPLTKIGRMSPGAMSLEKELDLTDFGVTRPVSGLGVVPEGYDGAGHLAFTTFPDSNVSSYGRWYTTTPSDGATDPLDFQSVTPGSDLPWSASFVYLGAQNRLGASPKLLIVDYQDRELKAYDVNADGTPNITLPTLVLSVPPNAGTSQQVVGLWGTALDPTTGDLLIALQQEHDLIALRGVGR